MSTRVYGEPQTAAAWRKAYKYMCERGIINADLKEYMFAICLYSDKTSKRSQSGGSIWPLLMTVLNQPSKQRSAVHGKGILGYIPVIKKPPGVDDKQFGDGINRLTHICYSLVLTRLLETERELLNVTLGDGNVIRGAMRLLMIVGDHPELQSLCGMSTAWKSQLPCRRCTIKQADCHSFYTKAEQQQEGICNIRTAAVVLQQREAAVAQHTKTAKLEALARHSLSAATAVALLYPWPTDAGPLGACPTDKMHHAKAGTAKDLLTYIIEAPGSLKELYHMPEAKLAADETGALRRRRRMLKAETLKVTTKEQAWQLWTERLQSVPAFCADGKYFRRFSADALGAKGLSCTEVVALLFQMLYALGEVNDVFADQELHTGILQCILAFRKMYLFISDMQDYTTADLDTAEGLIATYIGLLRDVFGPHTPFNRNMDKPKIHMWSHVRYYMEQFGAWSNFDTDHFELSHKMTKDLYARTNNHGGREEALTAMRRGMLRQELSQHMQAQAIRSSSRNDRAGAGVGVGVRTTARWLVPAFRKAKRLGVGAPCTLGDGLHDILLQKLRFCLQVDEVNTHLVRVHTGLTIAYVGDADGTGKTARWAMQARDMWNKQAPRHDDVLIQVVDADTEAEVPYYAQVLAFLSYEHSKREHTQLAFVRWYESAPWNPAARPVKIAAGYVQFRTGTADMYDVVDIDTIEKRVHLVQDLQFKPKARGNYGPRYYVHDTNSHCL